MFYNRKDIALRIAYLLSTAAVSGTIGGLVAYAVHPLDGIAGWSAWRWLILINGIPAVLTGIAVVFVLPNSPETATSLGEQDHKNLLTHRSAEVGQTRSAQESSWKDAKDAGKNQKNWLFAAGQWSSTCILYSFSVFLPTIIRGLGEWSTVQVQALTVPVYFFGFGVYLSNARISDKTPQRGLSIIGPTVCLIFGYCLLIAVYNAALSFTGTFCVAVGAYTAVSMPMSWLTVNNPRYGKRAIGSGIQLTIGNASGVAAPFFFSIQYAPIFFPGSGGSIGMLGSSLATWVILHMYFESQNRKRLAGEKDHLIGGMSDEEIAELGDKSPRCMYPI